MASLKGLSLTLMINGAPVRREVALALVSVQVTTATKQRSGFQLVFSLNKASILAERLLLAGYFEPLTRVIVVVTINGRPRVVIDGAVARQDVAATGKPGEAKLTVTGEDVAHYMNLVEVNMSYPAMPVVAQVMTILAKYAWLGIIPAPVPPLFNDTPLPTKKVHQQQGLTDLAYLDKLAAENGYVFHIKPGPAPGANIAYWGPEITLSPVQPALSVNMDAASNVESLSFAYDGNSATLVKAFITNTQSKLPTPVVIPDLDVLRPPLAARPAMPGKLVHFKGAESTTLRALAMGLARKQRGAQPITASGSLDVLSYGQPLWPGLVAVRGATAAYNGLYYVNSVTHQLAPGSYKQSFTLSREGLGSKIARVSA